MRFVGAIKSICLRTEKYNLIELVVKKRSTFVVLTYHLFELGDIVSETSHEVVGFVGHHVVGLLQLLFQQMFQAFQFLLRLLCHLRWIMIQY